MDIWTWTLFLLLPDTRSFGTEVDLYVSQPSKIVVNILHFRGHRFKFSSL